MAAIAGLGKSSPDGSGEKGGLEKNSFKSRDQGDVGVFGCVFGEYHGKIEIQSRRKYKTNLVERRA